MIAAQTPIAVTGSTGRLGSRVASGLSQLGVDHRLVVRDPSRAPALPGTHIAACDYRDGAAGVQRIVYVSFFGASPTATFTLARDHWATEEHLRSVGVAHTILRDNIYADFTPFFVGTDGNIRGPASDGRVAVVAQADIAEVAVAVLRSDGAYDGRTLNLTGPAALTMSEIANILSDHLGRSVSFVPETIEEAYASRAVYGAPRWQVDAWVSTYTAIAAGELATVTHDIPEVTGHPALSLEQVLAPGSGVAS